MQLLTAAFPYPLLENQRFDYKNANYSVGIVKITKNYVYIEHKIDGSEFLLKLLNEKKAKFTTTVILKEALFRKTYDKIFEKKSNGVVQKIPNYCNNALFYGSLVYKGTEKEFSLNNDDFDEFWQNRKIVLKRGYILAKDEIKSFSFENITDEKKYEFLLACLDRDEFLKFLRGFEFFDKDYKVRFNVDFKLSSNEFQYIPINYLEKIYKSLKLNELQAGDFNTWFYVNYEAVKNGVIEPYYFAFLENQKDGLKNITRAIREYKRGEKKFFEKVFRAILRRMFGAVKERGRKGVFQDVPFSIFWWKYYIYLQSGKKEVLEFLYERDFFYKELVLKMGFTLTVLADKKILKALLEYVSKEYLEKNKVSKKIIEKVAIASSLRSFGSLEVEEIKEIIKGL